MPELEHHEAPDGAIFLDDRHFPIVITTWTGRASHGLLDHYYSWLDRQLERAEREDARLVSVNDSFDMARPSGEIRARFVRETDAREGRLASRIASVQVATRGALLLGVLASIAHFVRGGLKISTFGTVAEALERALLTVDHLGVPRPPGLDPLRYERPVRPQR